MVSADTKLKVLFRVSFFNNSTFAGKVILLVLSLSQASVQLTSSNVKSACGCSSGGIGLSFLQEGMISAENKKARTNNIIFIQSPYYFSDRVLSGFRGSSSIKFLLPCVKEP